MRLACIAAVCAAFLALPSSVSAHCEVPCGIYTDQLRFESMLEDQSTILKAMTKVHELADKSDAQSINQRVRWVVTKEDHATKIQHVIAQYFMTQRLKPGTDDATNATYLAQLTSAHAVMQGAMKCKQTVDEADAKALREQVLAFHKAYVGKK